MNIHSCVLKILEKKCVTDGHTDGHTDELTDVKTVYPTTKKVCGGYNKDIDLHLNAAISVQIQISLSHKDISI